MVRRRALPSATVGKPIAPAKTPSSNNSRENWNALPASPTMIGVIGVSLLPVLNPNFFSLRLKNFVLDQSFLISFSPPSESSSSNADWQVAVTDGGCEVEKRNGRARW